ncbi:MAG: 2-oxoacid:acceptor oxidoreductase family protein [Candidatus Omnitrophota bacterium]
MTERIIIAGSGGQGVMLLGKILAEAGMRENRFVTWLPSYGAEVRGGTSYCMVTISDQPIGSPYIEKADTLIVMNQPSLKKFRQRLAGKGLLIVNSSLVALKSPKNAKTLPRPFTDIAIKIGNIKVANTVALGAYLAKKKIVSLRTVDQVMVARGSKGHKHLIRVNQEALQEGVKIG